MSRNTGGDPLGRTPPEYHRLRILDQNRHDCWYPNDDYYHRPGGGGGGHAYFKLMEDVSGSGVVEALGKRCDRDGTNERGNPVTVASWKGLLDGAQAGYWAQFCMVDGNWDFQQGDCITKCESGGSITPGTPVGGEVGTAYPGHTVTSAGLDAGTLAASGLPAGLTMDTSGSVSGTPTEAGTFYVSLSGTADKTGPGTVTGGAKCTVTKVMIITIAEAP